MVLSISLIKQLCENIFPKLIIKQIFFFILVLIINILDDTILSYYEILI